MGNKDESRYLFRGKRIDNDEWVYGSYSEYSMSFAIEPLLIENDSCDYEVNPETVGQYTGLTDTNGTKIFEGDIVELVEDYDDKFGAAQTSVEYGVVVWQEDYYCWGIKFEDVILSLSEIMNDYCVCVGNIHDGTTKRSNTNE